MVYHNKSELINLLNKEGLFAKKELSQNFLINLGIIKKIIKSAEITENDHIIEVGPGLGILTNELLKHAGSVRSIELDRSIIPYIKKEFGDNEKFTLEEGNVLKALLPHTQYKLVANIPYHITSPLLTHYLQPKNDLEKRPDVIVLLVQKEVAEKICADTGNHSILSLSIQAFGKPTTILTVSRNDFYPAPKVDSAILKIVPYQNPVIQDFPTLKKLISSAFSQKRKTLSNTIKLSSNSKKDVENILIKSGIDPNSRPQKLSLENWRVLTENVSNLAYLTDCTI